MSADGGAPTPFETLVRRRRMVRSYDPAPVDPALIDRLLDSARRAPSAGNTQGTHFVVLEGPEQTARFWDVTLPAGDRPGFPWPRLLDAPVLILPLSDEGAYRQRYREPDKAASGLGDGPWPVAYWDTDAAMATMVLLLAAVDAGLGALFFGIFRNEERLLAELGVPAGVRPIGAVALGHPTGDDRPSGSLARGRRELAHVVHRGGWSR